MRRWYIFMLIVFVASRAFSAPVNKLPLEEGKLVAHELKSYQKQYLDNTGVNGISSVISTQIKVDDFLKWQEQQDVSVDNILKEDTKVLLDSDEKEGTLIKLNNFISPNITGLHTAQIAKPSIEQLHIDIDNFTEDMDFMSQQFKIGDDTDIQFSSILRITTRYGVFLFPWPDKKIVDKIPVLQAIVRAIKDDQKIRLRRIIGYLNEIKVDDDGYRLFLKLVCYLVLGDAENAKETLMDFILTRISNTKQIYWWNYLYLGRLDFVMQNYSQAQLSFKQAIAMNPDRATLYLYMARASRMANQPKRAKKYFMKALEKVKNNKNKMVIMAFLCDFYASRSEWDKIIKLVNPYLTETHIKPIVIIYYMRALKQLGKTKKIESVLKQRIEKDPQTLMWVFTLAQFYWNNDHKKDAIELLEEEYENDTSRIDIGLRLARYNGLSGNIDETMRILEQIISVKPDAVIAMLRLGRLYYARQRYDDALVLLKKALDKNPNNPEILFFLGKVYERKEEYNVMSDYFYRYLKKFPKGRRIQQINVSLKKYLPNKKGM